MPGSHPGCIISSMGDMTGEPADERADDALVAALPTAYAVVVRMGRDGCSDQQISAALGVDPSAVGGLRSVAERKLAALRAAHEGP